jgi:hypothetical protein
MSIIVPSDQGPPGPRGNSVLNGTTNPTAAIGIDGDFYINTATNYIWGPKVGTWPLTGVPMYGPQGPAGPIGPPGPIGNTLLNGTGPPTNAVGNPGDFYLDTAASVMYGPKSSSTGWPATGTSLIGPLGGTFPDAPSDGVTYGRQNEGWTQVSQTYPDAPNDGTLYGRKSQAWAAVPGGVPDAPTDGVTYGRKNAAWAAITSALVPAGTVMLFCQAAAPVGWTQLTTHNDKALRIVSGAGGGSGGTNSFSSVQAQTTIGNHTLTTAELPSHTSTGGVSITVYPGGNSGNAVAYCTGGWSFPSEAARAGGSTVYPVANGSYSYTGGFSAANTITTTSQGTSGAAHNHPITMQMQYVDIIMASKN